MAQESGCNKSDYLITTVKHIGFERFKNVDNIGPVHLAMIFQFSAAARALKLLISSHTECNLHIIFYGGGYNLIGQRLRLM